MLYTRVNCGLRQVEEILKVINDTFDGFLGSVPRYSTIETWVKKCGLHVYEQSGNSLASKDYAQIVDESMMIGSEKLLLTLGIAAAHQGRPLHCCDVNIIDIAVAQSWNGTSVGQQLQKASSKVGHAPQYVISDNASIMNKGVRCAGFKRHSDISHSLGMFLERTYKNEPDFTAYLKLMTASKFKYNMNRIAYLLPPTQRTIARFINLSEWVKWSSKMLHIYPDLQPQEREIFSFVPANASLINELSQVMNCVKSIEHICKHRGLSKQTAEMCRTEINNKLLCGNERMKRLGRCINDFLLKEAALVSAAATAHHNSSDIIESLFGKYKSKKSHNKLNGVTSFVLFLPIYAKLSDEKQGGKSFDFKAALEAKRIKQIDDWSKHNLTQNLNILRSKSLRKSP